MAALSRSTTAAVLWLKQAWRVPAAIAISSNTQKSNGGRRTTTATKNDGQHACATCTIVDSPLGLGQGSSLPCRSGVAMAPRRAMSGMAMLRGRRLGSCHVAALSSRLRPRRSKRTISIRAGEISLVEQDIDEEPRDRWATLGEREIDPFHYGTWDGHHTWHEGDDGTFFEGIKDSIKKAGGPVGLQAVLAWAYLPALCIMMAAGVEMLYALLMAAAFVVTYIILELQKPRKFFHAVKTIDEE